MLFADTVTASHESCSLLFCSVWFQVEAKIDSTTPVPASTGKKVMTIFSKRKITIHSLLYTGNKYCYLYHILETTKVRDKGRPYSSDATGKFDKF